MPEMAQPITVAASLAQIGEFSFILAGLVMLYALASVARWVHEVEDDRHVISTRVLGLRRTQVLRIAVWPILWPRLLAFCASLLPAVVDRKSGGVGKSVDLGGRRLH